ncbi:MAG: hypothetical protein ABR878_13135 [Roseiarcus sp.]
MKPRAARDNFRHAAAIAAASPRMATDFQFRLRHFHLPDNPEALDRRTEPSIGAATRRRRRREKIAARQCAGRAISYW